jgi:hypothetical protein
MAFDDLTDRQRKLIVALLDSEAESGQANQEFRAISFSQGWRILIRGLGGPELIGDFSETDLLALRDEGYATLLRVGNGYNITLKPKAYSQFNLLSSPTTTIKNEDAGVAVPGSVDFVLVTALEEERDALLAKLPGTSRLNPSEDDVRVYYWSQLPVTFSNGLTGFYNIIVVQPLRMGRVEAANATSDAIRQWQPRYVGVVGIAGGVAENGVTYGDVLIPDQVADYELQKITPQGAEIRWQVYQTDARMLGAAHNLRDA